MPDTQAATPSFLPFFLAASLALAGGFADAASFVLLGVFSGHLTGNSILSGISIVEGSFTQLWAILTAVGGFVSGTIAGVLWRRRIATAHGMSLPLGLEILVVGAGILAYKNLDASLQEYALALCLSLALGIQNGVYATVGTSKVHTTYITGVTTSLLNTLFYGAEQSIAKKHDRGMFATVLCSFVLGGASGAFLTYHYGVQGVLGLMPPLLLAMPLCYRFFSRPGAGLVTSQHNPPLK
ncbi:MAG: YoaK family protein [Desulfovibrio sp.]|nr:YoaK family protein [Desulfovibrio sp.]